MQKEKDKQLEITQTKVEEQEQEIARLQYLLSHSSMQQQPQQSSVQVVSVPTVDEQSYQSYSAQPDPQYLQAISQQQAYQQQKILVSSVHSKVGIADESVRYERKEDPEARGFDKIVRYDCPGWIQHTGDFIEGNTRFRTEDSVALELNMDSSPRTLTFFVNDVEQPNFVINIPSAVRAFMLFKNESFKVLKFEALSAPTALHAAGSRFWEFGKYWKKDK
ncbi:MAG: hypothetical protein EZS28_026796 [Streblomastix strix]|uniref:Uncharacterized protein n=1 Tax=Streblomastix strix TaxID=222440 RepID=A0A5J4V4Z8_9EUKA|nr:MAG: hypothetical protein EZS28_026796 [Streblomastix strix]